MYSVTEELQAAESHCTPQEKCPTQLQGSLSGCSPTTAPAPFLIAPTRSRCDIGVAVFGPRCRWTVRPCSALGCEELWPPADPQFPVSRRGRYTSVASVGSTAIPSYSSRCRALQWGVQVLGKIACAMNIPLGSEVKLSKAVCGHGNAPQCWWNGVGDVPQSCRFNGTGHAVNKRMVGQRAQTSETRAQWNCQSPKLGLWGGGHNGVPRNCSRQANPDCFQRERGVQCQPLSQWEG